LVDGSFVEIVTPGGLPEFGVKFSEVVREVVGVLKIPQQSHVLISIQPCPYENIVRQV
jgi:hypothetical protein